MKICHLAITHDVLADSRIMSRMARSSADSGHNVSIITSGCDSLDLDGVEIKSISKKKSRKLLPLLIVSCFFSALSEKADVYHIHEVPLMICGLLLKMLGKKVVVDFHEDFGAELFDKAYLNVALKHFFFSIFYLFRRLLVPFFDAVVLAEDGYSRHFRHVKSKLLVIKNHPKVSEFEYSDVGKNKIFSIVYVGVITEDRGCRNIIEATREIASVGSISLRLTLIGRIPDASLECYVSAACRELPEVIEWQGPQPYSLVQKTLTDYSVGFAALHDIPNYRYSLPTKILEYNAAGLMCIASELPITRRYVESGLNGLIVRPNDTREIAEAILALNALDLSAQRPNVRKHAQRFSWEKEADKLNNLYSVVSN